MRSLLDIVDLTVEEIDELIATANDIIANPDKYAEKCRGTCGYCGASWSAQRGAEYGFYTETNC